MEVELTPSQRAFLRSRARTLRADVSVGKAGASGGVLGHIRVQLTRRELIKVRLLHPAAGDRRAAAEALGKALGAAVVDVVGRVVVLYKPSDQLPPERRLELPAGPPGSA